MRGVACSTSTRALTARWNGHSNRTISASANTRCSSASPATRLSDQRRMQELSEAVHLSQSALSRVVGTARADGLAVRGMCPQDRRGIYVCITDAGRRRYETARPAHRGALADALGAGDGT